MVATNLKAETMKLMDQRATIEADMNAIIGRLCVPGGPGLSGNLVDSEGFPRSDIDIPSVRADRHRLADLRNDHNIMTEQINKNIEVLHSARLDSSPAIKDSDDAAGLNVQGSAITATTIAMNVDVDISRPFAVVDEIAEASPAAEDGLQLGDQVVKFGNVESGDNLLQRLAAESQTNQGCAVSMTVIRQGVVINLQVTPRVWLGRGLLGCHFRMLG